MSEIDNLFLRINDDPIDGNLRIDIADLLLKCIEEKKESLGVWEKSLFAQSVSCLNTNLGSNYQPTDSWLRLCLVSMEKALVPPEQRGETNTGRDQQVDSITFEMLHDAVNSLKSEYM